MRLIDADSVLLQIKKSKLEGLSVKGCMNIIKNQPTVYDVDKVMEQLQCDDCESCVLLNDCNGNFYPTFMEKVREIVRKGGVDE